MKILNFLVIFFAANQNFTLLIRQIKLQIEMKIIFPLSMKDPVLPQEESIFIDLAPIALVPYSVYYFLEVIKHFKVCIISICLYLFISIYLLYVHNYECLIENLKYYRFYNIYVSYLYALY